MSAEKYMQYYYDINDASFGPGLIASAGHRHKAQRKMLNPVFTVKHMKSRNWRSEINTEHVIQTETFYLIAEDMKKAMIKDLGGAQSKELDMLRWCSATALELIGTAGIGHSFGTLQGVDSEYSRVIESFFPALAQVSPLRAMFPLIYRAGPAWLQRKLAGWAPSTNVRKIKNIVDVQDKQAQDILIRKKEALKDRQASNNTHDIMSVLVRADMEANREDRLPENQLLGQMNTLIFAGHEKTSGALSRTLQLLAFHPALQNRLRAELQEAPDALSYNELNALPYLDALCREVYTVGSRGASLSLGKIELGSLGVLAVVTQGIFRGILPQVMSETTAIVGLK
ncbi:hypothetical protein RSOLAG22IIIB_10308 [Rhizoctonia solani]|uniref:Cytochrome P450 n=1 Tax=Rhizoctonia solani TaxID=456999 RepID=A0A0K6G3H9_9AGAM|nr:hypothetical protein RSOLAG22IIIB_10308 [Rhizoctonia solani]